jgi:hypothetical protein
METGSDMNLNVIHGGVIGITGITTSVASVGFMAYVGSVAGISVVSIISVVWVVVTLIDIYSVIAGCVCERRSRYETKHPADDAGPYGVPGGVGKRRRGGGY